MTINEISKRNYQATVKRGLITPKTEYLDFTNKIREEAKEIDEASINELPEELADVALVCFAMAEHFGIDLIAEMEKKTIYNENRND